VSTSVIQPSTKIGTTSKVETAPKGGAYMMYGINSAGNVVAFNTKTPQSHGLIAYMLPDDAHLLDKDASGSVIPYTVRYLATDHDDPNALTNPADVTHCGNASWTFAGTIDGKGTSSASCAEDSFFANGFYPASGTIDLSETRAVGVFYSDESPMQAKDYSDPFWTTQAGYPDTDYGIIFELSGGAFTDVNGNPTAIPKSATPGDINATDGYTLTPVSGLPHPDTYNTRINYNLPAANDPRWATGVTYTLHIKAYDTDNNKLGNDCGQATWSFSLAGAP
jgi:hypothetical protein